MDEFTATIVASTCCFHWCHRYRRGASIIAVLVNSQKNKEIEHLKALQSLQTEYDKDLRTRRITSYIEIFGHMIVLAQYPEPDILTYDPPQQGRARVPWMVLWQWWPPDDRENARILLRYARWISNHPAETRPTLAPGSVGEHES